MKKVKTTRLDVSLVTREWELSQFHGNALNPAGTMIRMFSAIGQDNMVRGILWEEGMVTNPSYYFSNMLTPSPLSTKGELLSSAFWGPWIASTVLLIPQNTFQWKQAQLRKKLQGSYLPSFPILEGFLNFVLYKDRKRIFLTPSRLL